MWRAGDYVMDGDDELADCDAHGPIMAGLSGGAHAAIPSVPGPISARVLTAPVG
jgi:hypothetical protein